MQFNGGFQAPIHGLLWVIEVLWVIGFLAVFVVYFIIKHRSKKKKSEAAAQNRVE